MVQVKWCPPTGEVAEGDLVGVVVAKQLRPGVLAGVFLAHLGVLLAHLAGHHLKGFTELDGAAK